MVSGVHLLCDGLPASELTHKICLMRNETPMPLDEVLEIIEQVYSGLSLRAILGPNSARRRRFFETLWSTPSLEERYDRAQKARGEMLVEEIVEIADTERDAQKARNQIDARKWYASKTQPKKYGDRIDLNVNQTVDIGAALEAAKSRILPASYRELDPLTDLLEDQSLASPSEAESISVGGGDSTSIEDKTPGTEASEGEGSSGRDAGEISPETAFS